MADQADSSTRPEPKITADTEYELVRPADQADAGVWLVMVDGTQVGRVSRTLEGVGTTAWQATANSGVRARCTGKGATKGGNARSRDRAAAELMLMLAQRSGQ